MEWATNIEVSSSMPSNTWSRRRLAPFVLFVAMVVVVVATPPASASSVTFTEFSVPSSFGGPGPLTAGSDGNIWFAEPNDDAIGRISLGGSVTMFPLPSPYQEPRGIATGPDGAVWFTETGSHTGAEGIGRIDPSGVFTEFPLPANSRPFAIATGPDGNLWFTGRGAPWAIGRISPSGIVTTFPTALHNAPLNIVTGPDGALWFTEDGIVNGGSGAIGRITTTGSLSEYVLPTPVGDYSGAGDITVGVDGNLWFTWVTWGAAETPGAASSSVGRITPSGTITEFPVSSANGWPPGGIASGPDGALWFTESYANAIGRISTSGSLTAYPVPTPNSWPADITQGPDGNLWFSEDGIGRISFAPIIPAPSVSSFSPLSGPVGTSVTILGANFVGATSVTFSGVVQPSFSVDPSGTVITAAVPPGAATGLIQVTTPYGTASSLGSFSVTRVGAHERNVTLSLRRHLVARVNLVVSDGYPACLQDMHVRIQRRFSDHWRTIATDITDVDGSFIHRLSDRTGWYRARVNDVTLGGGDVCSEAISGTRHHNARSDGAEPLGDTSLDTGGTLFFSADDAQTSCRARNLSQHSSWTSNLQTLIDEAGAGNTLLIRGVCSNEGNFTISNKLRLVGWRSGATLDGGGAGTVLSVEPGAVVVLTNLLITNGLSASGGGGLRNQGIIILNSSSISGNSSGADGGGIFNSGGVVILRGSSSVSGNDAAAFGGGILNTDGARLFMIDSSMVSQNTGALGGGVLSFVDSLVVMNDASSVNGNHAQFAGGGIYNNSKLVINDSSSVTGNTAQRGAGIVNEGTNASVTLNGSSTVAGNQAETVSGGIENRSGTLTLTDSSSVTGNVAPAGGGGSSRSRAQSCPSQRAGTGPYAATTRTTGPLVRHCQRSESLDVDSTPGSR